MFQSSFPGVLPWADFFATLDVGVPHGPVAYLPIGFFLYASRLLAVDLEPIQVSLPEGSVARFCFVHLRLFYNQLPRPANTSLFR